MLSLCWWQKLNWTELSKYKKAYSWHENTVAAGQRTALMSVAKPRIVYCVLWTIEAYPCSALCVFVSDRTIHKTLSISRQEVTRTPQNRCGVQLRWRANNAGCSSPHGWLLIVYMYVWRTKAKICLKVCCVILAASIFCNEKWALIFMTLNLTKPFLCNIDCASCVWSGSFKATWQCFG